MEDFNELIAYVRLTVLLNDGAILLRRVFKELYKKSTGQNWEDTPEFGESFVSSKFGSGYYRSSHKIHKELLLNGNVNTWDVTILKNLITIISTLNMTSNDYKLDKKRLNSVVILGDFHTQLTHMAKKVVSQSDFKQCWTSAMEALVILGGDAQYYNQTLNASIFSVIILKSSEVVNLESMAIVRKLREDGNTAVRYEDFEKAIRIYSEAFLNTGISNDERALLLSNRAHARFKTLEKITCIKIIAETICMVEEDAKSAIELRPTWWKAYYRLGRVFQFRKEWKSAIVAFNRAIVLDSNQVEVKNCRDDCRFEAKGKKNPRTQVKLDNNSKETRPLGPCVVSAGMLPKTDMEKERDVKIWTMAANGGSLQGMEALSCHYLEAGDPDEAQLWFQRSLDGGNESSIMYKTKFETALAVVKMQLIQMQHALGVDESCNTIAKCQEVARKMNKVEVLDMVDKFEANSGSASQEEEEEEEQPSGPPEDSFVKRIWNCQPEIRIKADEGCTYKFTQILRCSMNYFTNGLSLLMELVKGNHETLDFQYEIVEQFANSFRCTEMISFLSPPMRDTLTKIVHTIFNHNKNNNNNLPTQFDLDARIVHAYLTVNSLEEVSRFLQASKLKYPKEIYFHDLHLRVLGGLRKFEQGSRLVLESLKLFPNNVELVYSRAVLLGLQFNQENKIKYENVKDAYLTFLEYAPKDHHKVPEAYYCLSYFTVRNGMKQKKKEDIVMEEVLQYYEDGLKAEQHLVSCFLPYDSATKRGLESLLEGPENCGCSKYRVSSCPTVSLTVRKTKTK